MIPLPNLSVQTRHGRDRKPYSRLVYGLLIAFWLFVTATYAYDLMNDRVHGPAWLNLVALVVSALFLAGYVRILMQYKGRMTEWATTVRNRNAAIRAQKRTAHLDLFKDGEK